MSLMAFKCIILSIILLFILWMLPGGLAVVVIPARSVEARTILEGEAGIVVPVIDAVRNLQPIAGNTHGTIV